MNKKQKSVIVGSLLGDGFLTRNKSQPTWNWKFGKNQCKLDILGVDKISYINFHKLIFCPRFPCNVWNYKRKASRIANNKTITPETTGYSLITRTNTVFTELGKKWYKISKENKLIKVIPHDIEITPLSMCIWYMDDGNKEKDHNRVRIATNCFQDGEVEHLVNIINNNFSLDSKLIYNSVNQPMIEIGGYENYKKFYDTILPHAKWDCFQYKIEPPKEVVILSGEDHPQAKLSEKMIKRIIKLYHSGKTQTEIAGTFNVKPNTISTIMNGKSRQLVKVAQGTKGEKNPRAKLNQEQVSEIRSLKSSMSYGQLAKKYKVSRGLVASIIKNRCWN